MVMGSRLDTSRSLPCALVSSTTAEGIVRMGVVGVDKEWRGVGWIEGSRSLRGGVLVKFFVFLADGLSK